MDEVLCSNCKYLQAVLNLGLFRAFDLFIEVPIAMSRLRPPTTKVRGICVGGLSKTGY